MSVIHEALQRAERERAAGAAQSSAPARHPAAAPATRAVAAPGRDRRRLALVAAVGGGLLVGAAALWSLWGVRPANRPAPGWVVPALPPTAPKASAPSGAQPGPGPSASASRDAAAPPSPGPDPHQLNAEAIALFHAGQIERAERLLEQALRVAPTMPEAHNNLGMVLKTRGRRSAAKEEFLRALMNAPGYAEALNNLGLVHSEEGNQTEALRAFKDALAAKPDYSSALLNLAIVNDKLGMRSDAETHYRRFLEIAGADESDLAKRVRERLRRQESPPREEKRL